MYFRASHSQYALRGGVFDGSLCRLLDQGVLISTVTNVAVNQHSLFSGGICAGESAILRYPLHRRHLRQEL